MQVTGRGGLREDTSPRNTGAGVGVPEASGKGEEPLPAWPRTTGGGRRELSPCPRGYTGGPRGVRAQLTGNKHSKHLE